MARKTGARPFITIISPGRENRTTNYISARAEYATGRNVIYSKGEYTGPDEVNRT
jgi:hypothetical protein